MNLETSKNMGNNCQGRQAKKRMRTFILKAILIIIITKIATTIPISLWTSIVRHIISKSFDYKSCVKNFLHISILAP